MLFRGGPLDLRLAHDGLERHGDARKADQTATDADALMLPIFEGKFALSDGALRFTEPTMVQLSVVLGDHEGKEVQLGVFEEDPFGDAEWFGLREIGSSLTAAEASLAATALALASWHRTHKFCPRCGAPTEIESAGWMRRCTQDGSEHYPRTDPAVIVAVIDDEERILLGSQVAWETNRWSILAGFVEAGESAEAAAKREILEESGVVIDHLEYLGSQAWPFPGSLMFGFGARAVGGELLPDGTEIARLRWFSRSEIAAEAARLKLPNRISIARAMIESWFGGELKGEGEI